MEQQLQEQVYFYQNALRELKKRSDEISQENANLYEQMRQNIVSKELLFDNDSESEHDDEFTETFSQSKERLLRTKTECDNERIRSQRDKVLPHLSMLLDHNNETIPKLISSEMEQMQKVYQTKAVHLEALLKSAKKQIVDQQAEISKLQSEIRYFKTPVKEDNVQSYCSKCSGMLHIQPVSLAEKKIVQRLTRERDDLAEVIQKQHKSVDDGCRREKEAYIQVKKSCELVEQVQLEKQEALVQVRQLKNDLSNLQEKYQCLSRENQQINAICNANVKTEMQNNINKLEKKVDEQSIVITSTEVQLEKVVRENVDLKQELQQTKQHIISQKAEGSAMIEESRKEVVDALKTKVLAEQETHQLKLDFKLREKQKQQQIDQLTVEIQETKRRLQMTEEHLQKQQKDVLDLTNQLHACQQQLQSERLRWKLCEQSFDDDERKMLQDNEHKVQEVSLLLQEATTSYNSSKEEFGELLASQTEVINKYKRECNALNRNILLEQKKYQERSIKLENKCKDLERKLTMALDENDKNDAFYTGYKQQIESCDEELADYKEQVITLMNKQSAILRDRHLLSKEVELLRNQLQSVKP